MSSTKQIKKFLNNLIVDNIDKIDGRSFNKIQKKITTSRGENLEQYKAQLPSILKSFNTKNKFTEAKLKEAFDSPALGIEYKQDYNITGVINYNIVNISKTGKRTLVPRQRRFNIPITGMTRKQINKAGFIQQCADLYVEQNDPDADYVWGVMDGKTSDVIVMEKSRTQMSNHRMAGEKYSIRALKEADGLNVNEGQCAIDYLMYELSGKPSFKNLSRNEIQTFFNKRNQFKFEVAKNAGNKIIKLTDFKPNTNDIVEFAKQFNNVSVNAIDPLQKVFHNHKSEVSRYNLCFIVNNHHLFPILDTSTKQSIVKCGRISLNESKFNISYDDYQFVKENDIASRDVKVLLYDDSKDVMMELMKKAMNDKDESGKKYMIDNIKFSNGRPVAFKHPITNQIIETTSNFTQRKNIIDGLIVEFGDNIIKSENQSYSQIANIIFDNKFGTVSQLSSNLSDKVFEILDAHHISPYMGTVSLDQEQGDYGHGYDVCKSYASGILNNKTDYAIFQQFDEVKPFTKDCVMVVGEYYVSVDIKINKNMKMSKGYYPLVFVNELLNRKVIKKSHITMYIPAKLFIKADVFKSFVEHIYTKYQEDDAKKMINFFIGSLGTKYSKIDTGCITTEFDIACALEIQYSDHNISIDKYEDLYFVRAQTKTKKFNTALPIHRHIMCLGIINLINLHDAVVSPEAKVICFNTDSIMVKYSETEDDWEINNMLKSDDSLLMSLGKIRTEDWKIKNQLITELDSKELEIYKPVEWNKQLEGDNFEDFCKLINDVSSAVIIGIAGSGKTEIIKNLFNTDKKILALAFTNKAIENLISRCKESSDIYTFDCFLNEHLDDVKKIEKMEQFDSIVIEEYSMAPVRFMNILNKFKSQFPDKQLLFFGDSNQCIQVDVNKIIYDYIETSTFNKMCDGNLFECSYKEQFSRYDIALKNELDYFLRNDIIQESLKDKTQVVSYHNICRSSEKKWKVNNECSIRYRKENPTLQTIKVELTKDIKSKATKISYNFTEGEELMCIDKIIFKNADGTKKLINGSICRLTRFEDDYVIVDDSFKMDIATFISKFEPNFCQTIYKYQGSTIGDAYNIHELHYLTKRELYTAMSRGKRLSDVHFKYTPRIFINEDCSTSHEMKVKINNDIDEKYINGKIYKISFNNDIYIGSTIQTLEERKAGHFASKKPDRKNNLFIETLENFKTIATIELIKLYPCNSLNQLVAEEMKILDEYINDGEFNILNTIGNRKKKTLKDTEIIQERLQSINIVKSQYEIVENVKKNILRIQTIIDGKKIDISVSLNKKSKEEATALITEKINTIVESLSVKKGKIICDWN